MLRSTVPLAAYQRKTCSLLPAWRAVSGLLAMLILLVSGAAAAPEALVDRSEVLRQAKDITREIYPDSDDVRIRDYLVVRYRPDGTAVKLWESYIKILTEAGRKANRSVKHSITVPYDEVRVLTLEVIKADGSSVDIDIAANSRMVINSSQMAANIYNPDRKDLVVNVPGLDLDDILHVYLERRVVKARMTGYWGDCQLLEYSSPIQHLTYEVHAPVSLPLCSISLRNQLGGTVVFRKTDTKEDNEPGICYTWEASNVPRLHPEPDMPTLETAAQRLLVSTIPDWEAVSRWYWSITAPHLTASQTMKERVKDLVGGRTDEMAVIEAIFRFVSQQIRYLGVVYERSAPGYEPHDASVTYDKRHGVCRDKAALLVALLREAGIEAYPALMSIGEKKDPDVPRPLFNHALVAVKRQDGSYLLVDPTNENTQELLPSYLNGSSYLVATPAGQRLQVSPVVSADQNLLLVTTRGTLDRKGRYVATSELVCQGINDTGYRMRCARMGPAEREQYFAEIVKSLFPDAKVTRCDVSPSNMTDTSALVKVSLQYEVEDVLIRNGTEALLPLSFVGDKAGVVNYLLQEKTKLASRRFPLEMRYACGVKEDVLIAVPEELGRAISLPDFNAVQDPVIQWSRKAEVGDTALHLHQECKLCAVSLEPEDYLRLKKALREIEYNSNKMAVLDTSRTGQVPEYGSLVLNEEVRYEVQDEMTWTETRKVRKRICSRTGRTEEAELKFPYNPAWDDIKITSVRVERGDRVQEVDEREMRVMDAPGAGNAPRYPGGKIVVVNLPGVEVGSTIQYASVTVRKNRPFFAMLELFAGSSPIQSKTVELQVPASVRLKIRVDENGILREDTGEGKRISQQHILRDGTSVYRWSIEDQPHIAREDALPPFHVIGPFVAATSADLGQYAAALSEAVRRKNAADPNTPCVAQALVLAYPSQDDISRVREVRDFVAKRVRRAGPDLDMLPLAALSSPDRTLNDGYGNTLDRALLLSRMLGSAHIPNQLVLVSSHSGIGVLDDFDREYPTPSSFKQVLVKASCEGRAFYLNDTDQYARLGTTGCYGRVQIPIHHGRDNESARVDVEPNDRSRAKAVYSMHVDRSGNLECDVQVEYYGVYYNLNNRLYSELTPEEKKQYYQKILTKLSARAQPGSELQTHFEVYPGRLHFTARVERYAVCEKDYLYVVLPDIFSDILKTLPDNRENPYYIDDYTQCEITVLIEWPEEYSHVRIRPHADRRELPAGSGFCRIACTRTDNRIKVEYAVSRQPSLIDSRDYDQFVSSIRTLRLIRNRVLLVSRN
jgi:hypothetical protein